jgi:threonine/homoserine/homoserine lactone efflux protein
MLLAAGSFVIALSGALMPGPLLTITIGESVKRGAKAGPLLIVGHSLLEGALVVLLLSGLSSLIAKTGFKIFSFVSGGAILLIMGYSMVRESSQISMEEINNSGGKRGNIILLGVLGSVSNPYWIIWWATIGLGYLVASIKLGIAGVVAFFIGHILADFAWYTIVSSAIAKGKKVFSTAVYRKVILFCGLFLVGFGVWFLFECYKIVIS